MKESGGADLKRKGFHWLFLFIPRQFLFFEFELASNGGNTTPPSPIDMSGVISRYFTGTGMVRHLTLTALEIQRDHTAGGAAATHLIFSLDGVGSV